ncbi:MAG: DNA mismatch repair endonuclease MutL [candidate division Zixibacteria bacterium]|nr:DNA mismatch repair endonuclease MutL [candidate division Zixibacteria bacterium]
MTADTGQPRIRPLPERLINKIAAGEVIERPAAVVKELVENALDAGADRVDIFIEKSGSKLIKIVDNGCGISEEQIEIAFSRHATSKIYNFNDLESLASYGFRGEALPSIASVARVRMVSRPCDADFGTEIIYEGGVLQSKQPTAAPPGTMIEVENLFFNTPARRKFLKSEMTESRHISRLVTALAIGRFEITFSYTLNNRRIFSLPGGGSLKERVSALLSPDREFIAISGESEEVKIDGVIGLPETAQSNRLGQYIFINGRFIYSPSLSHAFQAGYGELLPRGNYPVGALLLTVRPDEIDVNVHPSKTEIKLAREREIYNAVHRLIKDSIRKDNIIPSYQSKGAPAEKNGEDISYERRGRYPRPGHPGVIPGPTAYTGVNKDFLKELYNPSGLKNSSLESNIVRVDTSTGEIIEEFVPGDTSPTDRLSTAPSGHVPSKAEEVIAAESDGIQLVGRFSDLYLVCRTGRSLFIVDQHAAHERVLYEETCRQVENQTVVAQQLLFPAQVELSPEQLALFEEYEGLLNASGFAAAPFGGKMINIEAVPSVLAKKSPEKIIRYILDDLTSLKKAGQDIKKAMAQSIACRAAVMAGDRLTDEEATGLVKRLMLCENRYTCPHGRPTFIKMSREDLDRQFGRG